MTTLTVEVDNATVNFISTKHRDVNSYLSKLIKEDMLLSEIKESKKSGVNNLNSLDDLDKGTVYKYCFLYLGTSTIW